MRIPAVTGLAVGGLAVGGLVVGLSGCGSEGSNGGTVTGSEPSPGVTATAPARAADLVTNGVDELDPAQALEVALAELRGLASFRATGSPSAGEPLDLVFVAGTPVGPFRPQATPDADPGAGRTGRGVQGTLTRDGSTFEVLAVDSAVYVRGNLDWLAATVGEDARRTLGEKWLLLPDSVAAELEAVTDPDAFATAVLEPTGDVESVGVSLIESEPALGVRYLDNEATAWLAGTGPVLPVLVERLGATATAGLLRLSDFDAPVTVQAPAAEAVVVVPEPAAPAG